MHLSLVIPLLNEAESIPELAQWIAQVLQKHPWSYEVIWVDDGSTDTSWQVLNELTAQFPHHKAIRFRRNYGKSAALHVGFAAAQGQVVITLDADLQDSPDEIPALYQMVVEEGYDLVSGWKKVRHDSLLKNQTSKFYNAVTRWVSGIALHDFNCGLKAYRREVVKSIEVYGEMHRYIPLLAKWAGFRKIGEKAVQHQARKYGVTKFGLERFLFGFLDLMSVTFVSRFRKRPMHFFGSLGFLSFCIGLCLTLWLIGVKVYNIQYQIKGRDVVEQPLFFLALVAILAGIQLFLAGFLGEMIITYSGQKLNDYVIAERQNLAAD